MNFLKLALQRYNPDWSLKEEKFWLEACQALDEIEAAWSELSKSLSRYSEEEWLTIFPEAREVILEKIKEWEEAIRHIEDITRENVDFSRTLKSSTNLNPEWIELYIDWTIYLAAREIYKFRKQLARLKRNLLSAKKNSYNPITPELIELARNVSLVELISQEFSVKRSGHTYSLCCPFHEDKNPSFIIFTKNNRYKCFGCNASGDAIAYAMRRYDLNFVTAVKELTAGNLL